MNRMFCLVALLFHPFCALAADSTTKLPLTPPDSLIVDGIPPIPGDMPEQVGRYTESRAALMQDWNPKARAMLIATRFAETNQIHQLTQPGGARLQLTFFPDRVDSASFEPAAVNISFSSKDRAATSLLKTIATIWLRAT